MRNYKILNKIIFTLILLFIFSGIASAKINTGTDNFDGSKWLYVQNIQESSMFSLQDYYRLTTSFNLVKGSKNLIISYSTNTIYAIDNTIKIKIDDNIYTLTTESNSNYGNNKATIVFGLPEEIMKPLINTKNDIKIRITYNDISGSYIKDFKLPYNFLKEMQEMYTTK